MDKNILKQAIKKLEDANLKFTREMKKNGIHPSEKLSLQRSIQKNNSLIMDYKYRLSKAS